MKKTISLLIVSVALLSLVLCGCNINGKEETSTDDNESISYAIDKSSPITSGNLITKAKVDENGDINIEYYDNSGNVVEVFVWNEENQKSHTVMRYSDTNKLISKEELTPTGSHNLFTSYRYDDDDELTQSTISEYENGVLIKTTTYDKDENIIGYSVSVRDDKNRIIKIERYDADDTLLEYFAYELDENGLTTKSSTYNGDGTLKKYTVFTFNDESRIIKDEYYDSDDTLLDYYLYEYYENGDRKSIEHYDADGNLLSRDTFDANEQ